MKGGTMPAISRQIWELKYRYCSEDGTPIDQTIEDTWRRVARGLAVYERDRDRWEQEFFSCLTGFKFLPAGRIIANAGTSRPKTTLFNCYVLNTIEDSLESIFATVRHAALTQKQGGGIGMDFSTIRPQGAFIRGVQATASGPISYMKVFDATCRTIMSAGQRRGAQMAVMSCTHPDIEAFIDAKRDGHALRMFNLSVAITDEFIEAVKEDRNWDLVFQKRVHKTVRARDLWSKIMRATYDYAEPGFILIDRVNQMNNLYYCEDIRSTNPCGEQPLPPFGACLLGSVNLTRFISEPFSPRAAVDFEGIRSVVTTGVRMLDNAIDISRYPLEAQHDQAAATRRMGLGITGLADALIFLGLSYRNENARAVAAEIMQTICQAAYRASIELAREKGSFPLLDREKHVRGRFIQQLPDDIRAGILTHGIRNSHLTSIAPTGTISLLAGNVSSGLEPVFAFSYTRKVRTGVGDDTTEQEVCDYAFECYRAMHGDNAAEQLPEHFVSTDMITPHEHVDMQAALQPCIDSAISKTVNIPAEFPFDKFQNIYMYAYEKGLKGCTTFRPNTNIAGVLVRKEDKQEKDGQAGEPTDDEFISTRPIQLNGKTYKIKTPLSAQALYITINDVIEPDGGVRPFEIFINSKNLQHFSWMVAMTRLISAVFRRTSNPSFLVEELRSIFDPNGGYFKNGHYVPSLVAEIGDVIEKHLLSIGITANGDVQEPAGSAPAAQPSTSATAPDGVPADSGVA
jgi:ribonucleoside-diphosphate reductase alpha chain